MNLIASSSRDWGIGKENQLLFHIREDMQYFKKMTTGNVVVMGRKTLDSLPGGNPLPERVNIVMTRDRDFSRESVTAVHSAEELLEELKRYDSEVFVCGGGEIYRMLLPYCQKAYITKVNADREADAFLPDFDADENWRIAEESEPHFSSKGLEFRFLTYERV